MDEVTDEERRIFPGMISAADLMEMEFKPEPDEAHYRRGYRDGFIEAVNALNNRPRGISDEQLRGILFDHWEHTLWAWWRRATDEATAPKPERAPVVTIPGNVFRKPFSKATRHSIIAAAGFTCLYCGRESRSYKVGPGGKPWHMDHRLPLARGGTNEPDNLVLSCARCNIQKHTNRW